MSSSSSEPVLAAVIDYSRRSVRLLQETVSSEGLCEDQTERPVDIKQNPVFGTLQDIPSDDLRSLEPMVRDCQLSGSTTVAILLSAPTEN